MSDKQELASVQRVIQEAAATLLCAFVENEGWPYRISRGQVEPPPKNLSQSTTAMVSLALWKLLNNWQRPNALVVAPEFPAVPLSDRENVQGIAERATSLLTDKIRKEDGSVSTWSTTYGRNDPVTLSFLADLNLVRGLPGDEAVWARVREYVLSRTSEFRSGLFVQSQWFRDHTKFFSDLPIAEQGKRPEYDVIANAIIPLRIVQAVRAVHDGKEQDVPSYREYFETTLHDQLSFSSIPDSRFDPAELTFCLEGLLLAQRDAVDQTLFRRVVDVLAKAQQESAFWRPNKPFMATSKGFALFPVSVEVANSLLRSCEIYDGAQLHDTFGSASLGLFRRYWQWLRARTIRFRTTNGDDLVGWHSEHINETGSIHVWETSQVLEFLLAYHRLLQAHVARTTLILSRFSMRPTKVDKGNKPEWLHIQKEFEPVTHLGSGYEIYRQIADDFISGWLANTRSNYSMLLYGPPGTGKTTVAENIADALGYRMITITVSDFLAGGGAQLEARAKAIFEVLISQSNCVVLFDEIDNFLLDRDSDRYTKQDSPFQFMTPGMLTKLNDLRREKRLLFVIATNYENRIDPAIKRTGRIDKRYLVLPPDGVARKRLLTRFLRDFKAQGDLDPARITDWTGLTAASLFLGFKDIEGAVADALKSDRPSVETLQSILAERARTTSLSMYSNKLKDPLDRDAPVEEFLCLIGLALETEAELKDTATCKAMRVAAKSIQARDGVTDTRSGVKAFAPGLRSDVVDQITAELDNAQKAEA
ncbi:AAA family ATPase [Bradyrhizobium sp. USDA 329]|uniref:ATP-binding protein n=1 Tax=unclassified Bradyrhizobium TaxID=2631580 RepID=UPI003519D26B